MADVDHGPAPVPHPTATLKTWQRLAARPGGRALFSLATALRAPYFGTVLPMVRDMRPGRAVVSASKWWGVHNHIGTFHAIAACNLAEMAMGMLAEATVPTTHRWIPKGMRTTYRAKATTSLRAVAALDPLPAFGDEGQEIDVPVGIYDTAGAAVVEVTITIWVTPKKR
ncbi:hotdog fold domain-containing protein [Bounagaea algeriensis]